MLKFSVLFCTYNASERAIRYSLDSLFGQTIEDYEIIVCDDGSVDNRRDFYLNYFSEHGFMNYRLMLSPVNQGTVKNLLTGLREAKGEYVKPLGAGDALAGKQVLEQFYDFMKQGCYSIAFGKLKPFTMQGEKRVFHENVLIPLMRERYLGNRNFSEMKRNLIAYGDNISGAQLFYETNYFSFLMEKLAPCVRYMEDLCTYLAALEGIQIGYLPIWAVWYEVGSGISTEKKKKNNDRMDADRMAFLGMLSDLYPKDRDVIVRIRMEEIDRTSAGIKKALRKICADERWLSFRLRVRGKKLQSI